MKSKTHLQSNINKVYILFADLKEYSANKHDLNLIQKMESVLYDISNELFPENEHCFKVLGDGMLATDKNPLTLAQKSLKIIDKIKSSFEHDDAFTAKPQIRIALHLAKEQSISERYFSYEIGNETLTIFKDIAGEDVINTARIEPVVKPNFVFCSKEFANELTQLKSMGFNTEIENETLGTYKLGKAHDSFEVELCAVFHKDTPPNIVALKAHVDTKLEKREETYEHVSPLTGGYINQGTHIAGDIISNVKNVVKDIKGNIEHIGDKIAQNRQKAEKIYNIDNIDKADFS